MGSEQSTHGSNQGLGARQASLNQGTVRSAANIRRQHTIANPGSDSQGSENESGRPGSISPGPSVCSDSDLPYISYTVNRPIGGAYCLLFVFLIRYEKFVSNNCRKSRKEAIVSRRL